MAEVMRFSYEGEPEPQTLAAWCRYNRLIRTGQFVRHDMSPARWRRC